MMAGTVSRAKSFKDYYISTEDGCSIHAKAMFPKPHVEPRRVVFICPVVGAGAALSLLTFRNFTKRGAIAVCFEYRGHGESTGLFELDKTITDARDVLLWAAKFADKLGLPLHGFATCYGTIPLISQFSDSRVGCLMRSVSAVSALFRLDQILTVRDFAVVFSRYCGREVGAEALSEGIARNEYDWEGDEFRLALQEYLAGTFKILEVGRDYFEELAYSRVRIQPTLAQLLAARYLEDAHIPAHIPCNVFMGRQDFMMRFEAAEGRDEYAKHVRSKIPHAEFFDREFDHFGRGVEHDMVIDHLSDIFERYDSAPSPAPHFQRATVAAGGVRG
jgi:hypothetical protein